jgi:hypothetical protein
VLSGDLLDLRPLFFERGRTQARGDAAVLQKFNLFSPFVSFLCFFYIRNN